MKKEVRNIFLYFLGSFIPFFVLFRHFEIVEEPILIYFSMIIISIIVSLLTLNKKLKKVNILIMLILFIFLIINYQGTIYAFIQIYNSIIREYNKNIGINIATINIYIDKNTIFSHVFMFVNFIQYLISNIVIKFMTKEKYGKIFIFTLIIALPIILVQIPIDWTSWVLLITYWFLLYVCYYFRNAINQNKLFKLAILILSILSLTTALFINNFSETKLKKYYNPVTLQQEMFDRFNDWLQKISNIQFNENEVNLNHAQDRIYIDAKHLEVETDSIESMYLKYYSGDVYESNTWTSLNEAEYESMDAALDKSFKWITRFTFEESDVNEVTITDYRKGKTFSLYPYNMRSCDQSYETYFDMYLKYSSNQATFQVWDIDQKIENSKKDYLYIEFIKDNYLKIPADIEHLFKYELGLKDEKLHESIAKQRILSFLEDYTYTLSPGATPEDVDFVDYFLTQNKKGYCVHFATTATLMFRYYGIPARYVEGYHVSRSQFDENGKAEVLDRNAHAWVEIFDTEYGWKPIEVTVGQNEIVDDDDESNRPNNPNQPTNLQTQNQNTQNNQQNNQVIAPLPIGDDKAFDIKEFIFNYSYLLIGILLFFIYFVYRKIQLRIRMNKMNQKNRKLAVFAMYNYLVKIDQYSSVFNEEIIQLFEKNKFSKDGLNKEEYVYLHNIVQTFPKNIYQTLKPIQKMKYKYIDCLI